MRDKKWVLSIDGGGALGIGPATYLAMAERYSTKLKPHAYAGTSVGALLVALAASGRTWEAIEMIFRAECRSIFQKPCFLDRINPTKPKYTNEKFMRVLHNYFGNMKMNNLDRPVFLTSFDFHSGRPKVWDNSDDVTVSYAVLCSTAAPTYFPIIDNRYGDGGVIANNPAMVGIAGVVDKHGFDVKNTACFSLGTNGYSWKDPDVSGLSKLRWLRPIIETFMTGNEELGTFEARSMLGNKLIRVEPKLKHCIEMDNVDEALKNYGEVWRRLWFSKDSDIVRQWLDSNIGA